MAPKILGRKATFDISRITRQAESYFAKQQWDDAINNFNRALRLIPTPIYDYNESLGLLAGIADALFFAGKFDQAETYFLDSLKCPDAVANPFINLRIGQCLFENDKAEMATEYLLRAYMLDGHDVFQGQDEKYFIHLQSTVDLSEPPKP